MSCNRWVLACERVAPGHVRRVYRLMSAKQQSGGGYGAVIASVLFYFGSAAVATWLLRDYRSELPIVLVEQVEALAPNTLKEMPLRVPRDSSVTLEIVSAVGSPPLVQIVGARRPDLGTRAWKEFDVAPSFTISAESEARRSSRLHAGKYLVRLVSTHTEPKFVSVRIRIELTPHGTQVPSASGGADAKRTTASIPRSANRFPTADANSDSI